MTDTGQPTPERDPQTPPPAEAPVPEERRAAIGDTVGTGTSIALGCLAGTVVLILIGLIFLGVVLIFS